MGYVVPRGSSKYRGPIQTSDGSGRIQDGIKRASRNLPKLPRPVKIPPPSQSISPKQ